MSQQDYFIEFARELGALNGNIEAVVERENARRTTNTVSVTVTPQGGK